jgi:hypothetical protein
MVPKNIGAQILNVGAWARGSERVPVSLPRELEDFIPEVRQIGAASAMSDQYGGNNYLPFIQCFAAYSINGSSVICLTLC